MCRPATTVGMFTLQPLCTIYAKQVATMLSKVYPSIDPSIMSTGCSRSPSENVWCWKPKTKNICIIIANLTTYKAEMQNAGFCLHFSNLANLLNDGYKLWNSFKSHTWQTKPAKVSMQEPPFLQGFTAHASVDSWSSSSFSRAISWSTCRINMKK